MGTPYARAIFSKGNNKKIPINTSNEKKMIPDIMFLDLQTDFEKPWYILTMSTRLAWRIQPLHKR